MPTTSWAKAFIGTLSHGRNSWLDGSAPPLIDSPFISKGGTGDHMKDLLIQSVTSNNSNAVYNPSPHADTPFADLDEGTDTFSGQPLNNPLGQFGGPYTTTGPTEGYN